MGSIPFGYLVYHAHTGKDVRDAGSGNIGATNILRTLGKKAGITVLVGDCLKGSFTVLFAYYLYAEKFIEPVGVSQMEFGLMAGVIAILGHLFPIYIGFKGGKGVATALGIFLPVAPLAILITFLSFLIIVWISKYVSLGSILGAIILPVLIFLIHPLETGVLKTSIFISIFIIYKHRINISRLIKGEENKLGQKKKDKE